MQGLSPSRLYTSHMFHISFWPFVAHLFVDYFFHAETLKNLNVTTNAKSTEDKTAEDSDVDGTSLINHV